MKKERSWKWELKVTSYKMKMKLSNFMNLNDYHNPCIARIHP